MSQRIASRIGAWRCRLAISFFLCLGLAPAARAQPVLDLPPAQPARLAGPMTLTLEDCIRIGLQSQPAITAQRASVAAAQSGCKALERLTCANLISKELPIRKQQAACGVTIAQAGLDQAEWETIYAVTRSYFTMVYAQKQARLVADVLQILDDNRKVAQALIQKGDPDVKITNEDVAKLTINMDLLQARALEATSGVERALAALKEAMGVPYDAALHLPDGELPVVGDTVDRAQMVALALARRGELTQATSAARIVELEVCAQNTGFLIPFKKTFAAGADIHSRPIPQGFSNGTYRPGAIGIEMPTMLVGHKSDRVETAQDLSGRAQAVVEKTHNLIALETEDAFFKWQASAAQVRAVEQSVTRSIKLRETLAQRWFDNKVSTEDYLRALGTQDQARSQLNEALYHHALALAALERVTAGGFVPAYQRGSLALPK